MGQSLVQNYIHIVFSTKYRQPLIHPPAEMELHSYLGGICNNLECQSLQVGGYTNHVHILCMLSKKIALMKLVEEVKSHSSKWIKTKGDGYRNFYWQDGYGAFSVNPSETSAVIHYIANQHEHHKKKTFEEEYRAFLSLTFKKYAHEMSEFNAAFSYNYQHALTGISPDYAIDYEKALLSRGELPNATAPSAVVTGSEVYFTWTNNAGTGMAQAPDLAVLIAYCKELNQSVFTTNGIMRSSGNGTLNVAMFTGQTIETWIAFLSADNSISSNSIFTGELTV